MSAYTGERQAIAFRFHGLGERECTLFKSFMRLLDHRMHERWVQDQDSADVWVVPAGLQVRPAQASVKCFGLVLPIHADELETHLQQLGNTIMDARRNPAPAGGSVRLLRWPDPQLLGHPQRLRLATLLTGRVWTVAALADHAAVPREFCQQFVSELHAAGALVLVAGASRQPAAQSAPPAKAQLSLISRIRMRLGLATAAHA